MFEKLVELCAEYNTRYKETHGKIILYLYDDSSGSISYQSQEHLKAAEQLAEFNTASGLLVEVEGLLLSPDPIIQLKAEAKDLLARIEALENGDE